uniref:Uncharacterized protein n=2 Tax=Arundo donax TaxID=35708 RepID=A0A0A9FY52_ARUDO
MEGEVSCVSIPVPSICTARTKGCETNRKLKWQGIILH